MALVPVFLDSSARVRDLCAAFLWWLQHTAPCYNVMADLGVEVVAHRCRVG